MKSFIFLVIAVIAISNSYGQNTPVGGGDASVAAGNALKVFTGNNSVTGVKLFGSGGTWDTNWGPGYLQLYGSYIYDNGSNNLNFANGAHALSIHSGDPSSAVGISLNGASSSYFNNALAVGGTNGPIHTLHVIGDLSMNDRIDWAQFGITGKTDNQKRLIIGLDTTGNGFGFIKTGRFNVAWTNLALQPNGGTVSIGTTNAYGYTLAVNGSFIATDITVKTYANWPDYVFNPGHKLTSLQRVNTYIKQNRHLPDMPSAKEVAVDGLNLGDMNAKLLKKIEGLTLYLIEKDKELSKEKIKIKSQQQQLNRINKKLHLN